MKISIAQPVFSSTMFLVSTLISLLVFKDKMAVHQIAGIFAIIAGVTVVISPTDSSTNMASSTDVSCTELCIQQKCIILDNGSINTIEKQTET